MCAMIQKLRMNFGSIRVRLPPGFFPEGVPECSTAGPCLPDEGRSPLLESVPRKHLVLPQTAEGVSLSGQAYSPATL